MKVGFKSGGRTFCYRAKHIQPSPLYSSNQDAEAKISRLSLPRTLPSSTTYTPDKTYTQAYKIRKAGAFVIKCAEISRAPSAAHLLSLPCKDQKGELASRSRVHTTYALKRA